MTLTEARRITDSAPQDVMEDARTAGERIEAWSVITGHAAAQEDAERLQAAIECARANDLTVTYLVSLSPVADLTEVWRAVLELERVRGGIAHD